jgi:hypothetical protein
VCEEEGVGCGDLGSAGVYEGELTHLLAQLLRHVFLTVSFKPKLSSCRRPLTIP